MIDAPTYGETLRMDGLVVDPPAPELDAMVGTVRVLVRTMKTWAADEEGPKTDAYGPVPLTVPIGTCFRVRSRLGAYLLGIRGDGMAYLLKPEWLRERTS